MTEEIKVCGRCNLKKRYSEFGRNTVLQTSGRRDGLNLYCKQCRREDMKQRRAKAKERQIIRKPMVVAPRMTPREKVLDAIANGHRKFDEIKEFTGLHEDLIADLLAILAFDDKQVRVVRSTREFHLAA